MSAQFFALASSAETRVFSSRTSELSIHVALNSWPVASDLAKQEFTTTKSRRRITCEFGPVGPGCDCVKNLFEIVGFIYL